MNQVGRLAVTVRWSWHSLVVRNLSLVAQLGTVVDHIGFDFVGQASSRVADVELASDNVVPRGREAAEPYESRSDSPFMSAR